MYVATTRDLPPIDTMGLISRHRVRMLKEKIVEAFNLRGLQFAEDGLEGFTAEDVKRSTIVSGLSEDKSYIFVHVTAIASFNGKDYHVIERVHIVAPASEVILHDENLYFSKPIIVHPADAVLKMISLK